MDNFRLEFAKFLQEDANVRLAQLKAQLSITRDENQRFEIEKEIWRLEGELNHDNIRLSTGKRWKRYYHPPAFDPNNFWSHDKTPEVPANIPLHKKFLNKFFHRKGDTAKDLSTIAYVPEDDDV